MALDLSDDENSGIQVICCGDAHISNFGFYASPERRLVFDINDFDETLPGPWEWDVKRLAVSMRIAARENGFKGRVPLSVLNLPFRVTVPDIGLNGILITEAQDSREFEIVADENAAPAEQTLFVTARVETNQVASPEQASVPIRLKITARQGTQ